MKNILLFLLLLSTASLQAQADFWWQKVENKHVPEGTPSPARTADGSPLYIARAVIDGGVHLGKYKNGWSQAAIPYGGEERWVSDFEVFTGYTYPVDGYVNSTHPDAFSMGKEADGTPLFAAVGLVNGEECIGKARQGVGALLPWGGREHVLSTGFKVLSVYQYFRIKNKRSGLYLATDGKHPNKQVILTGDRYAGNNLWRIVNNNQLQAFCDDDVLSAIKATEPKVVLAGNNEEQFGWFDTGLFMQINAELGSWELIRNGKKIKIKNKSTGGFLSDVDGAPFLNHSPYSKPGAADWELELVDILTGANHFTIFNIPDITDICPTNRTRGDRDFNGSPFVTWQVDLQIEGGGTRIDALISFKAEEVAPDHTTLDHTASAPNGDKRFRRTVYEAPAGRQICGFKGESVSRVAGFKALVNILSPEYICSDGPIKHSYPQYGGPVASFQFIGDTGADDISDDDNCKCDTKIVRIVFHERLTIFFW